MADAARRQVDDHEPSIDTDFGTRYATVRGQHRDASCYRFHRFIPFNGAALRRVGGGWLIPASLAADLIRDVDCVAGAVLVFGDQVSDEVESRQVFFVAQAARERLPLSVSAPGFKICLVFGHRFPFVVSFSSV
jgi:hypothetical protein